ncbi:MAG: cytochrome c biogenesis protein CcdA [Candidatus Binatia bacterium]|nr:cytochrome c biogenesis protein CcdA [Candidatus Binatia bacterium]MDG2010445.1 cytochrome c biogenesis protein CcdA [Candidatus Binatia bacterium]
MSNADIVQRVALSNRVLVRLWIGLLLVFSLGSASPSSAREPIVEISGTLAPARDGSSLVQVRATIAHGFHVNAHLPAEKWLIPTTLSLVSPGVSFADFEYPDPLEAEFAFAPGKTLLVYEGTFFMTALASPPASQPIEVALRYQACDDQNCLPPKTVRITIGSEAAPAPKAAPSGMNPSDPSWLEQWLTGASMPAKLGMMLLLGLGLNLTPCVYPLISVTLAYFGGQSDSGTSSFRLSIFYVLGITLSFALLGTSAALAGGLFGAPLQNPLVLLGLAGVLLALSGSCFGLYELRAPSGLVNRVGSAQTGQGGAFLMGLTMGIVAAPCIGPVVLGLLVYVGSQKDLVLGLSLFAAMGLGMGLPYIGLASAAGSISNLPRSGEWLRWTNRLFGVLLLGMAYYFLTPLIPQEIEEIALPLLVAAGSIYLGFLEPAGNGLGAFRRAKRALGVAGLALGIWLALPGAPMAASLQWTPLSPNSLSSAIDNGRPAVVEFGAEWCLPCVEMENTTFRDPIVARESQRFSMLQADVTEESTENTELLEEFGVSGVPTIIFYDASGRERKRLVGYVSAKQMLEMMQSIPSRPTAPAPEFRERRQPTTELIPTATEKTDAEIVVAQ